MTELHLRFNPGGHPPLGHCGTCQKPVTDVGTHNPERPHEVFCDSVCATAGQPAPVQWTYAAQLVPGHTEWLFHIGLGGPCWCVNHIRDSYTGAHVAAEGEVTSRGVPVELVRWLLDNCPPLDSWVRPTKEQVQAAWKSDLELKRKAGW